MTQTVRFTGRLMNADEEVADIACRVASASTPPSRRDVGPRGDVQISISPTAIVLYEVEPESMASLRAGTWTHVHWSGVTGEVGRDLEVWQLFIEGENVRVLV